MTELIASNIVAAPTRSDRRRKLLQKLLRGERPYMLYIAFLILLSAKMITKFVGVFPVTRAFKSPTREGLYTTLLMSTGLTFGSISALFGLSHGIVTQDQYSLLIAAVIGSAVVPTLIANAFFLPHHLIGPVDAAPGEEAGAAKPAGATTSTPATGTKA